MSPPISVCVDRPLPDQAAALPPWRANRMFAHDWTNADRRLALQARKRWPNGIVLNCVFLDGSPDLRARVAQFAREWETCANIKLRFDDGGTSHVRISLKADPASWSAVGSDALNRQAFPDDQPTMNLGWFRDVTPDEEARRVVLHEFGHALGAIHEHQQPNASPNWDSEAVYRAFSGPPNNWSPEEIDHNIFERYSVEQSNSSVFDPNSIMLYHFPPDLFRDRIGTPLNSELSQMDREFMKQFYPRRGQRRRQ